MGPRYCILRRHEKSHEAGEAEGDPMSASSTQVPDIVLAPVPELAPKRPALRIDLNHDRVLYITILEDGGIEFRVTDDIMSKSIEYHPPR